MSLIHSFCLIQLDDIMLLEQEMFYNNLIENIEFKGLNVKKRIFLNDDIFGYLYDVFSWLPSESPSFIVSKNNHGLNRHALTLLNNKSYFIAKEIFEGLLKIFNCAPNIISLKGEYLLYSDFSGEYDIINIDKKIIIDFLLNMIDAFEYLNKENYYIVHLGI